MNRPDPSTQGMSAEDAALLKHIRQAANMPEPALARLRAREHVKNGGRARACDGKKGFRTPEFALSSATFVTKQFGLKQEPYLCPYCEQYHLTRSRNQSG